MMTKDQCTFLIVFVELAQTSLAECLGSVAGG
jgi:hypothetical protein